LIVKIS